MEPIPCAEAEVAAARRILRATAFFLVLLAVISAQSQIAALFRGKPAGPQSLLRNIDAYGYYAWLRSPLIDGDLEFDNEFEHFRVHVAAGFPALTRTPAGHTFTFWSVGPALLWAGPVTAAHIVVRLTGAFPADGFSPPYQLAASAATTAFGLLGMVWMHRLARRFATAVPAAVATSVLVAASMLPNYFAFETCMAHGPATALTAGLLLEWVRKHGRSDTGRWIVLGALVGLVATFRWQLIASAIVPAVEGVGALLRRKWSLSALLKCAGVAAAGVLIGFAPQMVGWQIVFGAPFVNTHDAVQHWLAPEFGRIVFAANRGWWLWHPVAFLGCLGLARRFRSNAACPPLLAGVLGQVYVVASLIGSSVFLGGSFGCRLLTEATVITLPGLALILGRAWTAQPKLVLSGSAVLILWNALLLATYRFCLGDPNSDTLPDLPGRMVLYYTKRPLDAALVLAAAANILLQIRTAMKAAPSAGS